MEKFRTGLCIFAARCARFFLRLLGRGATAFPGKVALRIQPRLLFYMAKGKDILAVTGTNGKTTTTHMISEALTTLGYTVITNVSGANMASGIATSMIEGISLYKKSKKENKPVVYVLEIDEAAFSKINGSLSPKVQVVTNLFRDQLDRYGEITHTRDFLLKGLAASDGRILLNADDSIISSLSVEKRTVYFGMNVDSMQSNNVTKGEKPMLNEINSDAVYCHHCQAKYAYHARSFGHLGDFYCPSCGLKREKPVFSFSFSPTYTDEKNGKNITPSDTGFPVTLSYREEELSVRTTVPGVHNFYNLMAAVSACTLLGEIKKDEKLSFSKVCEAMGQAKPAFGRMEKIKIEDKYICLLLVKNPVGLERTLSFLSEVSDAGAAYFLLNSNDADGRDVSWIWDVDFEARNYPEHVFVSGERYGDMLLRLVYAGVEKEKITYAAMTDCAALVDQALAQCKPGECLYILPNYTALLQLRKILADRYKLKAFWK